MTSNFLELDKKRYLGKMPMFQYFFRKTQFSKKIMKKLYKFLFTIYKKFYHVEIGISTDIGPGLYIGHPYCITINPKTKIGKNCNVHKNVTIGQENRGSRQGCLVIGDEVLIAPNSFVNRDIPSSSVVFGNPCIIKHGENATEEYINRKI